MVVKVERCVYLTPPPQTIKGECQTLINHFEDNPDDVTLMVGQRDSSKAVSTEALMTVFHPQDMENLDPKMVNMEKLDLGLMAPACLSERQHLHVIKICPW